MENKCYLCSYAKTIVEKAEEGHRHMFYVRCFLDKELKNPCGSCEKYTEDPEADEEAREFFFTHFTEGGML